MEKTTSTRIEDFSTRLHQAEVLWDTAVVGTPAADRYDELRHDLIYDICTAQKDEELNVWLSAQESPHTKLLLTDAQKLADRINDEDNYSATVHLRYAEQCNSYALARRYAWLPTFESDDDNAAWIDAFIQEAWSASPGYRVITSFAKHREAFEWLRAKHAFPDLQEIIGPPIAQHHLPDGSVSLNRKRELLLLGLFTWRGFTITYRRWHFGGRSRTLRRPRYSRRESWQWLAATACAYPRLAIDHAVSFLRPPEAYVWRKSLNVVARTWGIEAETKKQTGIRRLPRVVACDYCGNYFVSTQTKRISYQGRPRRFCNEHATLVLLAKALQPKGRFKRP